MPGQPEINCVAQRQQDVDGGDRRFQITAEIARGELATLEVSYHPDNIHILIADRDEYFREKSIEIA